MLSDVLIRPFDPLVLTLDFLTPMLFEPLPRCGFHRFSFGVRYWRDARGDRLPQPIEIRTKPIRQTLKPGLAFNPEALPIRQGVAPKGAEAGDVPLPHLAAFAARLDDRDFEATSGLRQWA
jgi:hypothetical protein